MFLSMNETNISFIMVGHGLLDYISLTLKQFILCYCILNSTMFKRTFNAVHMHQKMLSVAKVNSTTYFTKEIEP